MNFSRETLVAELRRRGITFLAPSDARSTRNLSDGELIRAILEQSDSRLHLALMTLFLHRPNSAQEVLALVNCVDPLQALTLQTLYTAAVYLQRLWQTRLRLHRGPFSLLPDLFSSQLNLPSPDERFGKVGLHILAEDWSARSTIPFNRLASINKFVELYFESLRLENLSYESTTIS